MTQDPWLASDPWQTACKDGADLRTAFKDAPKIDLKKQMMRKCWSLYYQ